jgi:hypothetical protein
MLQNVQRFQGQLRVTRIKREWLPPSLGGRYTPVSKLYFLAGSADMAVHLDYLFSKVTDIFLILPLQPKG